MGPCSSASESGDHIDLDQGVAGNATGGCDRSSHWRLVPKSTLKSFIHCSIVFQIVQIDVALEDLVHGGTGALELLLDLIQNVLGVRLDVALEMRAHARQEQQ